MIINKVLYFFLVIIFASSLNASSVVRLDEEYSIFKNPLYIGADPWIIKNPNGEGYYFTCTTANDIKIAYCKSPAKIGEMKTVFIPPPNTMYSHNLWAPELHYINDEWYIYFAADDGNIGNHRMFVLRGTSQDPTKPFKFVSKINDKSDVWAIDGTILHHDIDLYFVWSGEDYSEKRILQNIYIAHMSNPWTIDSPKVMLSRPEYDWERNTKPGAPYVNEGPVALYKDKTIHIIYSGSFCETDFYSLGMISFRGGDIMNLKYWKKSPYPLFSKTNTVFAPGHNSFFKTPDGQDWIMYHANFESNGKHWERDVRIQPFTWRGDILYFGKPLSTDETLKIMHKKKNLSKILAGEIMNEGVFKWF